MKRRNGLMGKRPRGARAGEPVRGGVAEPQTKLVVANLVEGIGSVHATLINNEQ
jgi:hypothetical protein